MMFFQILMLALVLFHSISLVIRIANAFQTGKGDNLTIPAILNSVLWAFYIVYFGG